MSEFKVGDKVRITREGYVGYVCSEGIDVYSRPNKQGLLLGTDWHEGVISIERIEPPVEVFKPGDRLRRIGLDYEVTLGSKGYLQHLPSGNVEFNDYDADNPKWFNSENFEKIL